MTGQAETRVEQQYVQVMLLLARIEDKLTSLDVVVRRTEVAGARREERIGAAEERDKLSRIHREQLEARINRLNWTLVAAAISFGTGALFLALNLWIK